MAYLGIGYSGPERGFLKNIAKKYMSWLKGDRLPRFYGDDFIVLYDSNTAREFAKKCMEADPHHSIHLYVMEKETELFNI